jgi:hypothetical protein
MRVGGSLQMGLLSPPPPPPATTNPLRSVHCCSRYLFKGLITLRFMWGGGSKRGGVQVPRLVSLPFVLQCLYGRGGGGDNWYRAHKDK